MKEPFSTLLAEIQELFRNAEFPIKAWRGLLSSYFRYLGPYASSEVGRNNWGLLRVFLKNTYRSLPLGRKHKPAWMAVLDEHPNLLEKSPCERYASAIFEGDSETIEELKKALTISETSWFIIDLLRTQVKRACSFEDSDFKRYLSTLCKALRENVLYVDEGLIAILTRYSRCSDSSEHAELTRLAIDRWGNPKLPGSTGWGNVSQEVKAMVLRWLISKDLRAFFDLFAKDHEADQDQRRLSFWMRYLDQIQDAYFVLGRHAYSSCQEDYVEVKRRNEGRISKLERGGLPNNNAFIMLIGKYAIVEFGAMGNACFCFNLKNLPFQLGARWLGGDKAHLKNVDHPGCKFRLIHRDGNEEWEAVFDRGLRSLDIYPDSSVRGPTSRVRPAVSGTSQNDRKDSALNAHKSMTFKMQELIDFSRYYRLKVIDLRN
ncbi:MAG: EH signature domain-containing protein, partial [Bdellovibrionota bacterium]